ncbi:solute carrier family 35 member F5 [Phlebotomus argentipes]|uniref:solute carrier family 35 member F5 n=1 Tax=Phlebotomus argentipes TaxID=94469 RepID=UPI002892C428|nr:solute carrier family 35 member F5 [Phlebotomus argentipes]XP_059612838.1 solute carrier family 35 member F5 [Phlebotomus argentipes]
MANRTKRLILGTLLLLLVDVIWVSSSELTKFLYQDQNFDKPFFCTYFKTSMFTIYLLALGLLAPWRDSCPATQPVGINNNTPNYTLMDTADEDSVFAGGVTSSLSDSSFVPVKVEGVSGTDSDDSSIRSVRFSKMAEVREMSPHDASEALMSRLSYSASLRIRRQKSHHKTARTALMFSILWFVANYLFQLALEPSDTAMVTLLSSTSSLFTLVLAALFPSASGDRFTLSKVTAVAVSIAGVTMVTLSELEEPKMSKGVILALTSAFFYASYLVLVKRKSDTEEKIDIPLFFGFVGLWNLLLLWPIFFVLNFSHVEPFELPNRHQFSVLFLNGLIGTVLSEALWLWGCFLTSSLIGTLAMTFQIPLAMLFDVVLRGKAYPLLFYLGSIPMIFSMAFVAVLLKYEDSDPVLRVLKAMYRRLCFMRQTNIVRINTDLEEQQECLIDNHDN